jgi:6-pyruvoyltetrahydropterin/6-carboxytetrahydropterin synthase
MISVTKIFEFEAAHHLPEYEGACSHLHGHSYKLEVEVAGVVINGMVIDFSLLKRIVKRQIIDIYDHQNLNAFFVYPSAEKMVSHFVSILGNRGVLPENAQLVRLRLWETSTSYAEWRMGE